MRRATVDDIEAIAVGAPAPGTSGTIRPPEFDVANAIGAAIARVCGEVDRVVALEQRSRPTAVDEVREEVVARAITAGARGQGGREAQRSPRVFLSSSR